MYTYRRLFLKNPKGTKLKGNLTLSQGGVILCYDTETIAGWPNGSRQLLATSPAVLFSPQNNQYAELLPTEGRHWLLYQTRNPDSQHYFSGSLILSSEKGFGFNTEACTQDLESWLTVLGCRQSIRTVRMMRFKWFENYEPIELLCRPTDEI
jgi:hypothetical protein